MRVILFVLAALAMFYGIGDFVLAKSAIHEIEGMLSFILAAVFLGSAAVTEAINISTKKIIREIVAGRVLISSERPTGKAPITPGEERYFVLNGTETTGPFSRDKIQLLFSKEIIDRDTMVARVGSDEWIELKKTGMV